MTYWLVFQCLKSYPLPTKRVAVGTFVLCLYLLNLFPVCVLLRADGLFEVLSFFKQLIPVFI